MLRRVRQGRRVLADLLVLVMLLVALVQNFFNRAKSSRRRAVDTVHTVRQLYVCIAIFWLHNTELLGYGTVQQTLTSIETLSSAQVGSGVLRAAAPQVVEDVLVG